MPPWLVVDANPALDITSARIRCEREAGIAIDPTLVVAVRAGGVDPRGSPGRRRERRDRRVESSRPGSGNRFQKAVGRIAHIQTGGAIGRKERQVHGTRRLAGSEIVV